MSIVNFAGASGSYAWERVRQGTPSAVIDDAINANYYDRIASAYRHAYRLLASNPTAGE